jgi:hypothetical protein
VRGANRLAGVLTEQRELALLFRDLATLRADAPLLDDVESLRWSGPTAAFAELARSIDAPGVADRAVKLGARHH